MKDQKSTFPLLVSICTQTRGTQLSLPNCSTPQGSVKHMHQLHLRSRLLQHYLPRSRKTAFSAVQAAHPPTSAEQRWALIAAGDSRDRNYPSVSPKPTLQPSSPSVQRNSSNDTWNWGLDPLTSSVSLGIFLTISWTLDLLRSQLGN